MLTPALPSGHTRRMRLGDRPGVLSKGRLVPVVAAVSALAGGAAVAAALSLSSPTVDSETVADSSSGAPPQPRYEDGSSHQDHAPYEPDGYGSSPQDELDKLKKAQAEAERQQRIDDSLREADERRRERDAEFHEHFEQREHERELAEQQRLADEERRKQQREIEELEEEQRREEYQQRQEEAQREQDERMQNLGW